MKILIDELNFIEQRSLNGGFGTSLNYVHCVSIFESNEVIYSEVVLLSKSKSVL